VPVPYPTPVSHADDAYEVQGHDLPTHDAAGSHDPQTFTDGHVSVDGFSVNIDKPAAQMTSPTHTPNNSQ